MIGLALLAILAVRVLAAVGLLLALYVLASRLMRRAEPSERVDSGGHCHVVHIPNHRRHL